MNRPTSTVRNHRILIVDDDDVLRRWLRVELEARGFEVWEESQGDEALSAYERNGPWCFVLSDLYFYRGERIKNGSELVHAITVITPGQPTAIHTSERDFQASVPVLIKPYPIDRLLRLLREPLQSLTQPSSDVHALVSAHSD